MRYCHGKKLGTFAAPCVNKESLCLHKKLSLFTEKVSMIIIFSVRLFFCYAKLGQPTKLLLEATVILGGMCLCLFKAIFIVYILIAERRATII